MIKYAANAFLATKVSFINEIANLCEVMGADVHHVARPWAGWKDWKEISSPRSRLWRLLFPKDTRAYRKWSREGYSLKILDAVITVNEEQKKRMIHKS